MIGERLKEYENAKNIIELQLDEFDKILDRVWNDIDDLIIKIRDRRTVNIDDICDKLIEIRDTLDS